MEKAMWNHRIFGIPYFMLRFADGGGDGGSAAGDSEAAGAADTGTNSGGSDGGSGNGAGTGSRADTGNGDGGQPDKQFTQADLDAAVEKRLARERKKWERESKQPPAGKSSEGEKSGEGTQQEKDDSAEKISKANARLVKSEAKAAAIAAGVKPEKVPYVVKLADLDGIDVDDDDGPDSDAIKKAIDKVLKDMPEFKAQAAGGGSGTGFQVGADGSQSGGKPAQNAKPNAAANVKRWNRFR